MKTTTLTPELLHKMDAYWRAANYLSVGQIYLYDNPLLKRPLTRADVKHMLLGHWGTTPGQNFIYVHLNRVITKYDLDMLYVSGPGHGGPAVVGNTYLEGTYSEIYPDISRDEAGLQKLFLQFSFPGGIPSHASPECPGSIHEGGELGYSLSHAFGAVFDNPDLVVACVVGDGEAETGPLATAWHANKFLNPATDGAVLPILHLNGYKIANPTILARIEHEELDQLLRGYGWTPLFVEGHEPALMHEAMATALDTAVEQIKTIQQDARVHGHLARPRWPMIVLNSPKGWTGPKIVDGRQIEGTFRAHQVPLHPAAHPEHLALLEDWLHSYRPEELFDAQGRLQPELAALAPTGERRMGANPHANGGMLLRDLRMPDFRDYAAAVPTPGERGIGDTRVLGPFLRDVAQLNTAQRNFRVFGPDETLSNGLEALFDVTPRQWDAATLPHDEWLAPTGRVLDSMLSEHQCEGWLEGYLLTGRHGLFNCYEAFIHIIDSMFNQHAKWLKVTEDELDKRFGVAHECKVGRLIVEIDGDRAVFACRFGTLSHVSSPCRWLLVRMRHREGNVLKDQAYCERIGASPLNPMECETVSARRVAGPHSRRDGALHADGGAPLQKGDAPGLDAFPGTARVHHGNIECLGAMVWLTASRGWLRAPLDCRF